MTKTLYFGQRGDALAHRREGGRSLARLYLRRLDVMGLGDVARAERGVVALAALVSAVPSLMILVVVVMVVVGVGVVGGRGGGREQAAR